MLSPILSAGWRGKVNCVLTLQGLRRLCTHGSVTMVWMLGLKLMLGKHKTSTIVNERITSKEEFDRIFRIDAPRVRTTKPWQLYGK
ncbi:MAG: hypothetical protein QXL52_05560 [Nitrososphaerales archaeon]